MVILFSIENREPKNDRFFTEYSFSFLAKQINLLVSKKKAIKGVIFFPLRKKKSIDKLRNKKDTK